MDEFQAFVTRVKQLHMSRSADADCDQNLSHDKGRRRYQNATMVGAADNPESNLLKPYQIPSAKSLDEQQLKSERFNPPTPLLDDFEAAVAEVKVEVEEDQQEAMEDTSLGKDPVKVSIQGETKEMKKNIQVMVGIDEELKMILEMDPEIVDLGGVAKTPTEPKVFGLPPLSGR